VFGYIKPDISGLIVKEHELYRAVYCSLCRMGGKRVSRLTRFFLSYDFTALALLRLAVLERSVDGELETNGGVKTKKVFCPYTLKRKNVLVCDEVFEYTAADFACLLYFKAKDDVADSGSVKRLFKRLALPVFWRMKRRAAKLYPTLFDTVSEGLSSLAALEKDGESHTLDELADGFAQSVADIAAFGFDRGQSTEDGVCLIAREAGYHIGRFIYLADAMDDLDLDVKRRLFNPLVCHYGSASEAREHWRELEETLKASALRFSAAVGLAPHSHYTDILQNIAQRGMALIIRGIIEKNEN